MFYHLFESSQHSSTECDYYQTLELTRPTATTPTLFNEPVQLLTNKNIFILADLVDIPKDQVSNDNVVRQSDLIALLAWMKQSSNEDATEKYFK
jgi:hypothetical protein